MSLIEALFITLDFRTLCVLHCALINNTAKLTHNTNQRSHILMLPSAQRIAGGAATDSLNYFCVEVPPPPARVEGS
jgi:hypothetical protein